MGIDINMTNSKYTWSVPHPSWYFCTKTNKYGGKDTKKMFYVTQIQEENIKFKKKHYTSVL